MVRVNVVAFFRVLKMGGLAGLIMMLPLLGLEIRLYPPQKFYNIDGIIHIDLSSTDSLLSGDDVQNLFFDIPITITYYIEFYEDNFFFDKKLVDIAIVRRVTYDHWSESFFIEEGDHVLRYRNLTQLRNNMIYLKKVKLISADQIDPDKEYYFKTRIAVKIKNFTLYYYLINNLISIFKYKTTYYFSPIYRGKDFPAS